MGNANKDLVIINNTPLTPRKRGVEFASPENYALALELWRTTCAEAGLAFIVDNCTANGARKVAARYLDAGTLTQEAIKKAMGKLAYLITHNEKAQHYTLNALGNNISRYLDVPKYEKALGKRLIWRLTCEKCGADSVCLFPTDVTPPPIQCMKARWGHCDGTAYPKCEGTIN